MNILVIAPHGMYTDYTASFVHNQAREYVRQGHRVRVLLPLAAGKRFLEGSRFSGPVVMAERDGVELCFIRYLSLSSLGKKGFNQSSACRAVVLFLKKALGDFRPDVIHAHTIDLGGEIGAALKQLLGCPLVVTTHGETNCDLALVGRPDKIRALTAAADVTACVSSRLFRELEAVRVISPLRLILNGFVTGNIRVEEKEPYRFLQVGNLIPLKKNRVTIRAFAELRRRWPEASLVIVGDGPERPGLEALCRELGIAEAVRFTGHIPNPAVLAEMAKARFFVMPSSPEGFGIVYLEAMSSGCVTVGTEGEGIADLIVSGENGFLVPPDDPGAIVQYIEWCIQNPERSVAIAERGRQAARGLTWEKNAAQYLDIFKSLLGKSV